MKRQSSLAIGLATLACAAGIGYVMQYGVPGTSSGLQSASDIEITEIELTSSARITARGSVDDAVAAAENASVTVDTESPLDMANEACDVSLQAKPAAGAMVHVLLEAPCNSGERVTFHHSGLMFTDVVPASGALEQKLPAFNTRAVILVSLASGGGASAVTDVHAVDMYDRVAVQWRGDAGLQLHAREFDADYFSEGHVWATAQGTLEKVTRGDGGFLTQLGRADLPEGLVAEVYSFPGAAAARSGQIQLSVEAEISDVNCAQNVEAQTLEKRPGASLRTRDLTVEIPACDSVGDFLVLKNLVQDLSIAANR